MEAARFCVAYEGKFRQGLGELLRKGLLRSPVAQASHYQKLLNTERVPTTGRVSSRHSHWFAPHTIRTITESSAVVTIFSKLHEFRFSYRTRAWVYGLFQRGPRHLGHARGWGLGVRVRFIPTQITL